jgi:glutamate dehydrogenase
MLLEVARMLERSVLWMLRHVPAPMDMAATIKTLKPRVEVIRDQLEELWTPEVSGYVTRQAESYEKRGVPAALARRVASIYRLACANDVSAISDATGQTVPNVAKVYFLVGERFGLGALRGRTEGFARISHWDRLAVSAAIEELFAHQSTITQRVIVLGKAQKQTGKKALDAWLTTNQARVDRYDQVFAEIKAADALSLAMLTVANRQLSAMTAGT